MFKNNNNAIESTEEEIFQCTNFLMSNSLVPFHLIFVGLSSKKEFEP